MTLLRMIGKAKLPDAVRPGTEEQGNGKHPFLTPQSGSISD